MQYVGGKKKLAEQLLSVMVTQRYKNQWWVEPFVGGANIIDKVEDPRMANDSHYYLISLFKAIQRGWIPPERISKNLYYDIKLNFQEYSPELVGFVGFMCSFGAKWWGGYASNKRGDNYAKQGKNVLLRQIQNLKECFFTCNNFVDLEIPSKSLIYCDPPYANTTGYGKEFNHSKFWDWCRNKAKEGNTVFVSEYEAPNDFVCVMQVSHKVTLDKNLQYLRVEKLFKPML